MRFYTLAFVFSLVCRAAFAQTPDIVYSRDTVYYRGVPYCILKEFPLVPKTPDYSLRNFSNDELAYIKVFRVNGKSNYWFTFKKSGNEVAVNTMDKKAIPSLIVNSELVKNGAAIDSSREVQFVINNGGKPVKQVSDPRFRTVKRNRNSVVVVVGEDITQELGTRIGTFKESGSYVNKIFVKQLVVYLPGGQKIAEASYPEEGATTATVMTVMDNKQTPLTLNPTKNPRKQVIDWLIENEYL